MGSRGAGKTWMLGQLLAALGPESVTIRLSASKSLAAIPFGAVNARVGTNVVRSNDYYEVLNGLLDQIHASAKSASQVLLMVDNAEHLDSQSTAIILQVVMSSSAKLILVDQHGGHQSHLRELWRDGHLSRFELAPLKPEDVQGFLEGAAGRQGGAPHCRLSDQPLGRESAGLEWPGGWRPGGRVAAQGQQCVDSGPPGRSPGRGIVGIPADGLGPLARAIPAHH